MRQGCVGAGVELSEQPELLPGSRRAGHREDRRREPAKVATRKAAAELVTSEAEGGDLLPVQQSELRRSESVQGGFHTPKSSKGV